MHNFSDFDSFLLDEELASLYVQIDTEALKQERDFARNAEPRMASARQIKKVKALTYELWHVHISKTELRRYERQTFEDISRLIQRLQMRLDAAGALSERAVVEGQATDAQLTYLVQILGRMHRAPVAADMTRLYAASSDEIHELTSQAMIELQQWNDNHGVPIPEWRLRRGL
jgi:hypothetical protein